MGKANSFGSRESGINGVILDAHKILDPKMHNQIEQELDPMRDQLEDTVNNLTECKERIDQLQEAIGMLTPEVIEILSQAGEFNEKVSALENGAGWLSVANGIPCCTFNESI